MVWQPGKKLKNGQYTIESILGKGGFGITYSAINTSLQRVAIKTLNDDVRNSPYFEKLHNDFQNEANLLQECAHPNIVKIYDLFLEEDLLWGVVIKGEPFLCMVMEYIDGENLLEKVEKRGSLEEGKALRYIKQIGKVLTFIHAKNILIVRIEAL
jgi:serine/threonine protein kinase